MIRIDEIYYNVFVRALQHRPRTGLHWFDPFGTTNIENLCNVPPVDYTAERRLIFWDQEPAYRSNLKRFLDQFTKDYTAHDTVLITSEVYSQDVKWACDTYGIVPAYYFFHGWAALDWYRGYNHSFLSTPPADRKFQYGFMCPNNIVGGNRLHRIRFLAELVKRGIADTNLISFPSVCPYENRSVFDLAEEHNIDLPEVPLPLVIDINKNHANDSHRIDFWEAGNTAFAHVVTETVYNSDRVHLTEKTFKPIVMQQPFMLVAPRGSLAYLRDYGFQTFGDIWDESYDELDDDARLSAIADICADLANLKQHDFSARIEKIQPILQHNHDWFYNGFQHHLWQELKDMILPWQ